MKGVPTKSREEEFLWGMVPNKTLAAIKGVLIIQRKEEFVWGMVQHWRSAYLQGVPTNTRREGFVLAMVQEWRLAATKDVPTELPTQEFVCNMVKIYWLASTKDVATKSRMEEFASDMVHRRRWRMYQPYHWRRSLHAAWFKSKGHAAVKYAQAMLQRGGCIGIELAKRWRFTQVNNVQRPPKSIREVFVLDMVKWYIEMYLWMMYQQSQVGRNMQRPASWGWEFEL